MKNKVLSCQLYEALRLLEDHKPHKVEFWKISTGDIEVAHDVVCTSRFRPNGTHNLTFPNGQVRKIRDITFRKIDDIEIYL